MPFSIRPALESVLISDSRLDSSSDILFGAYTLMIGTAAGVDSDDIASLIRPALLRLSLFQFALFIWAVMVAPLRLAEVSVPEFNGLGQLDIKG